MTADTVGGVFAYGADLIAGLTRRGAEVTLATFGRSLSPDQRRRLEDAGVAGIVETELALEWMERPWRDVAAAERLLLDLERDLRPDVVHLNAYAHGGAPFAAPALVVGHSCVLSWWAAVNPAQPPSGWERYRTVVRGGLTGAAAVVAPSRAMLSELERCYGPLRVPARVILNGSAQPEAPRSTERDRIVLGAARLWDDAKNAGALCRVARRPALRGRVLLAGERGHGNQPADGEAGARLLGALLPERLAEIRRRAAVFAAPARYEPFGLAILEAARDGCALVLGDIPSLRELWDGAATFVDPDDEARLGDTLEQLLHDPGRATVEGERARRRSRRYTVGSMSDAYLDLYQGLVRARQAPA